MNHLRHTALVLIALSGCPSGIAIGPEPAPACEARPCPPGAYDGCESDATPTTCCAGGEPRAACELDAGILTDTCPGCDGGVCAVRGEVVTCWAFGR